MTEPYNDYVTIAAFNPTDGTTTIFDTIFTQSTQCVIVDSIYVYVAAQDSVVKYNLDTYERIAIVKLNGVNQIKVSGDYLIAGRQYPTENKFVKILNKADLIEVEAFSDVSGDTHGIVVYEDKAYVAVNGGFMGTDGKLAVIDLSGLTPVFEEEIALGEQAWGISDIYLHNDIIYSVNRTSYGGSLGSFTTFNLANSQVTSTTVDYVLGEGYGMYDTKIYASFNGNIGAYDVGTEQVTDIIEDQNDTLAIMGAVYDKVNEMFYVNYSDWSKPGLGVVYNMSGEEVDTYDAGISAEVVAIDYRITTGISDNVINNIAVKVYPNPCTEYITIEGYGSTINSVEIFDITGKQISKIDQINQLSMRILTDELRYGVYLVSIKTAQGVVTRRVVKN